MTAGGPAAAVPSRARSATSSDLRRILPWLRPYWRAQIVLACLQLVGTALSLAWPLLLRALFDQVFVAGRADLLPAVAAGLFGSAALGALLSGFAGWLQTRVTARILVDLRVALLAHLQRLGPRFHGRHRLGDLLTRMGADLNEVQQVATNTVLPVFGALVTLLLAVGLLLWLQPLLFACSVAFLPFLLGLLRAFRPRIQSGAMEIRRRGSDVASAMAETLQQVRFVQASAAEEAELDRFRERNVGLVASVLDYQRIGAVSSGLSQVLLAASSATVLVVGGWLVQRGSMTVGDLVAFALYQSRLNGPAQGLAGLYLGLQRARAAVARVFAILDEVPEVEDRPGALDLAEVRGEVVFDDVWFSYEPGRPVLAGASFRLAPGSCTAIVGPSGVGKTTLVDLLYRFHHPERGRIAVDGHDLRDLAIRPLRRRMALVSQQPVVFAGSLRSNLVLGLDGPAPEEDLARACGAVGLDELVSSLPRGLDTEVGERGAGLSEGQRQRIGIARALLRRPEILVLDEVTSSLDWEADSRIAASLDRLRAGATTLIVTHRLSLAAAADEVVVLEGGTVVQRGPHASLVAEEGLYRRLWRAQTAASPAEVAGP